MQSLPFTFLIMTNPKLRLIVRAAAAARPQKPPLLHRHALGKVARLVHVAPAQ